MFNYTITKLIHWDFSLFFFFFRILLKRMSLHEIFIVPFQHMIISKIQKEMVRNLYTKSVRYGSTLFLSVFHALL